MKISTAAFYGGLRDTLKCIINKHADTSEETAFLSLFNWVLKLKAAYETYWSKCKKKKKFISWPFNPATYTEKATIKYYVCRVKNTIWKCYTGKSLQLELISGDSA